MLSRRILQSVSVRFLEKQIGSKSVKVKKVLIDHNAKAANRDKHLKRAMRWIAYMAAIPLIGLAIYDPHPILKNS
jgi:hypothetical protein